MKTLHPVRLVHALAVGFVALSAACAADKPTAAPTDNPRASIQSAIGDAACDSDAQCMTIGVGAKACGGPESYLAWSTARTDGQALRSMVAQDAERRRKEAAARGEMSNCAMVLDPGAYCAPAAAAQGARGVCRLRSSGSAGPVR
jgi:hypothetical protein